MLKRLTLIFLLLIPVISFPQNNDIRILRSINSTNTTGDRFFKFASNTNNGVILGVPLTMGIISLIRNDDKMFTNACQIVAADAINLGFTMALKYSIDRNRPFVTYPDIIKKTDAKGSSFPSGHTSGAFATATTLSLQYPKWYVIAPSYLWASTVAYSRMHLGVHYPSDVAGGILVGAGSAFLSFKVNKWLNNYSSVKHAIHKKGFQ